MKLAIVIPMLDEAQCIAGLLERLAPLQARGVRLIAVDGGSRDDSVRIAAEWADQVITTSRGRARQMNAGAQAALAAGATALLFLHADTELPEHADHDVLAALSGAQVWGRFDVEIEGRSPWLKAIAFMMNWRSRLSGIATGDQAIFIDAGSWIALGGYADQPLMEDIEFSRRARLLGAPAIPRTRARTSGRRWERDGVWSTIVLMWRLRLAYFLGADPAELARRYRPTR